MAAIPSGGFDFLSSKESRGGGGSAAEGVGGYSELKAREETGGGGRDPKPTRLFPGLRDSPKSCMDRDWGGSSLPEMKLAAVTHSKYCTLNAL